MKQYLNDSFSYRIVQGDDFQSPLVLSTSIDGGETKVPIDLTGATIVFNVRPKYASGTLVTATITPIDLATGKFIVSLTDEQTNSLPAATLQFQLTTTIGGDTKTRGRGNFIVKARIQPE
jgi:hypothetical protein